MATRKGWRSMNEQKKSSVKWWPFYLLIPTLVLAWIHAYGQIAIPFTCTEGRCWTTEDQLDRLQEGINQLAAKFIEYRDENESLKRENDRLKKRTCA